MSPRSHIPDESDGNYIDPSAIILPHVETNADLISDFDFEELVVYAPPVIVGIAAFLSYLGGNYLLAGLLAAPAIIGGLLAMHFVLSSTWYSPPRERAQDWLTYLRSRRSLPWGHEQTIGAGPVHGVRSIRSDGTVECRDGRYALAIPVSGTNADYLAQSTVAQIVGSLSTGVNSEMKDFWFAFYSTNRPASNEEKITALEDRVMDSEDSSLTPFQELLLLNTAEWLGKRDVEWEANEWHDYIEIQVFPHEYDATREQLAHEQTDGEQDGFDLITSLVGKKIDHLFDRPVDHLEDESEEMRTPDDVLRKRIELVDEAISRIDGVQLGEPSPATAANLLLEHWSGGGHITGEALEQLISSDRNVPSLGEFTPTERLLAPDHYDNVGQTMVIDDTVSRTFWISQWPITPESFFLRNLQTVDGIDISIRLIAQPAYKQDAIDELELAIARAEGEGQRRAEKGEVSVSKVEDGIDALRYAHERLTRTNTQAWDLSGYVTVHAETQTALRDDCDEIERMLQDQPASCQPVAHGPRQKEIFASGSPFTPDVFDQETSKSKKHRALSGAFGTMFPFIRSDIHDPDGIRWGRNTQTGESFWADPFDRGTAPHLFTIGKSRGGKTYGVSMAIAEWWLAQDDRTLILCDTQGGFDGVTELLGGDHIVVDGSNGVNPFYIQFDNNNEEQTSSFSLKVDEVTEFISGILRAQDIDPGKYRPTIQLAVQATYNRFGISNESIPEDPESPTIGDFIDTLEQMVQHPEDFSHTQHEAVAQRRQERVADLLEKLTGFMESGKYSHLVNETSSGITSDTRMAYLDLRHFEDATDAEKSVQLHLMLSQVSQLIKQTPGETIFLIDEAHLLLHSDEMLAYLQSATREWARYQAAMWFVSQSPQEFVRRSSGTDEGQENHREVILEQCSTTQIFYCGGRIKPETLTDVGLPSEMVDTARQKLTPGKAGKGYSECLVQFDDESGWIRTRVEAPPLLDLILSYKWHEHGDFIEYLSKRAGEEVAQIAAESRKSFAKDVVSEPEGNPTSTEGKDSGGRDDTESSEQRSEDVDTLRINGDGDYDTTIEHKDSEQLVDNESD